MTLHAHFELTFRIEAFRIQNRGANLLNRCARTHSAHVLASWSMTTLAIDTLRNFSAVTGLATPCVLSGRHLGVAVVAEHAAIAYFSLESRMAWIIVVRTHGPQSAMFGVPAQRHLG